MLLGGRRCGERVLDVAVQRDVVVARQPAPFPQVDGDVLIRGDGDLVPASLTRLADRPFIGGPAQGLGAPVHWRLSVAEVASI